MNNEKYIPFVKIGYGEVLKNVKLFYEKTSGEETSISSCDTQIDIAIPAKIDILGEKYNKTIYFRIHERNHYYNTTMVKEIYLNHNGNAYRIQLDGGNYTPSKYISYCNIYVYNKEMIDTPDSIDKNSCIFENYYEIELDQNTNIITEVIRKIKEKEIKDKPLTTDNDIYRKIVKLIRMAKTEEEAIELLEENLKLLLITDSAKTIIDNDLLEGPLVPPYVQERIDQEWEDFGKMLEKHNQKNIGTKPNNRNNKD